jgi:hypothetical protein
VAERTAPKTEPPVGMDRVGVIPTTESINCREGLPVFKRTSSRGGSDRRPLAQWSARLAVLAAVSLAAFALTTVASGATDNTVKTQGTEQFVPNSKIMSNLKFAPGHVVVRSGEALTLQHADQTDEPHTLTVINADEVPDSVEDVFECAVCGELFGLFPPPGPTSSVFVNAPGTGPGIDGRLDTLFVLPGESISARVTAPSGSILHFFCAIHPWMQGSIDVR